MNCRTWALIAFLLLPVCASAEDYVPPDNFKDPARQSKERLSDPSLPFIYLEPHDFCYDLAKPLTLTLSAVNRSGKDQTIDWQAIVDALVLEPVGPGRVTPVRNRPAPKSVTIEPMNLAQTTIDLKDSFKVEGASVYRLSYAKPLEDGRIHIAAPVQFVIEDDAAVDKLAATLDAGAARDTVSTLLKDNYVFAAGGEPKTYGWDELDWPKQTKMREGRWDKSLVAAIERWRGGIARLTQKGSPAMSARSRSSSTGSCCSATTSAPPRNSSSSSISTIAAKTSCRRRTASGCTSSSSRAIRHWSSAAA